MAAGLSTSQTDMLTALFNLLDYNNDGCLSLTEFSVLGEAMLGKPTSEADSKAQLEQADLNRDGMLNKTEWLKYSQVLARLPADVFEQKIKAYMSKVEVVQAKCAEEAA